MTERFISDDFWDDPMIEECDTDGKCLYVYLFSNKHQKPHGIMTVSIKKISSETGIAPAKVEALLVGFGEDKVKWIKPKSQIWVKNFIIRQTKNASFLQSAINHLFLDIKDPILIKEYLEFYATVGLWCKYGEGTVFTPSNTVLSCNNTVLSCPKELSLDTSLLQEVNSVLGGMNPSFDRLIDHEQIKKHLGDLGTSLEYDIQTEYQTADGRIDIVWLQRNKGVAAFEIDYASPKDKSVAKLKNLGWDNSFIILRTNQGEGKFYALHLSQLKHRSGEETEYFKRYGHLLKKGVKQ